LIFPKHKNAMPILNETHDPALRSWVASANQAQTDFPIQNLPFAVFRQQNSTEAYRGGVAIGDQILDLAAVTDSAVFSGATATAVQAASGDSLNALMALGQPVWSALRLALSRALRDGAPEQTKLAACLIPQAAAEFSLPARIGNYTDLDRKSVV
jgi:fumarylacetoacetase